MSHAFKIFDLIHKCVNSLDIVKRITREMIADFSSQNCAYLEIRTTPKVTIHSYSNFRIVMNTPHNNIWNQS